MRHIVGQTAWRGVTVELDGRPVADWYEADDEAGYVLIPIRDADGVPMVTNEGQVALDRYEGRVTFIPVDVGD